MRTPDIARCGFTLSSWMDVILEENKITELQDVLNLTIYFH